MYALELAVTLLALSGSRQVTLLQARSPVHRQGSNAFSSESSCRMVGKTLPAFPWDGRSTCSLTSESPFIRAGMKFGVVDTVIVAGHTVLQSESGRVTDGIDKKSGVS